MAKSKPPILSPALLNAARAFAHVCNADGRIAEIEIRRFADVIKNEPWIANESPDAIALAWEEAVKAVEEARSFGGPLVPIRMEVTDPQMKALMMRVAQAAVVADVRLEDQEGIAIRMLADALGLDPDNY